MNVLRIVLSCFIFYGIGFNVAMAQGLSFMPRLEPVNVVSGDPGVFTDQHSIAQDNRGHVCIAGGKHGLQCYDGNRLRRLYPLATSLVKITEGNEKHLHFSDQKHIFRLYNGQVQKTDLAVGLGPQERIKRLVPDGDMEESYFILSTHAIYHFSAGQVEKIYALKKGDIAFFVQRTSRQDMLEVGTQNGLLHVNEYGVVTETKFKGKKVVFILDDLVLTNKGLFQQEKKLGDGNFFSAFRQKNGSILLAGNRGLCVFHERLLCPKHNDDIIKSVYADGFGNTWAITSNGFQYSSDKVVQHIDRRYGLTNNQVFALAEKAEQVYMGTLRGVNTFNMQTAAVGVLEGTQNLSVRALLVNNNHLWIASLNKGLFIYDLLSQSIRPVANSLDGRVVSMVNYKHAIWVATQYSGLRKYSESGDIIEHKIHPGIKQIRKLSVCGGHLYVASIWNGLIKLNANKNFLEQSDMADVHDFACSSNNIVAASKTRIVEMNADLNVGPTVVTGDSTTALLYFDDALWVLKSDGIFTRSSSHEGSYLMNLDYLYNNAALIKNNYLFSGSTRGLVIIDLHQYRMQATREPVLLSTVNVHNGEGAVLTVDLFFDNLMEGRRHNIYYQFDHHKEYTLLTGGSLPIIDKPQSTGVSFRAVNQEGATVFENRLDLDEYLTNTDSKALWFAATSWPHIIYQCGFYLFACIIALLLFRATAAAKPKENAMEQHLLRLKSNMMQSDYVHFARIVAELRRSPRLYGEEGKNLLRCIDLMADNKDIRYAKNLADRAGISPDTLRENVRTVFKLKGSKEFIALCNAYIAECEEGLTTVQ